MVYLPGKEEFYCLLVLNSLNSQLRERRFLKIMMI